MNIKDILDIIFNEHQIQCNKVANEIYPIIQKQLDLARVVRGYRLKTVAFKTHKLTAMYMCYISYIMVLEGEYYG